MKLRIDDGCLQLRNKDYEEVAYATVGIRGLQAEIEFPSDWHEHQRAWVRIGLGFCRFAFSFPWHKTVPDEYQCSGPTYGFQFHAEYLWLKYGKDKGRSDDPRISITMPWGWKFQEHIVLSEPEKHPYQYVLKDGTIQNRTATIFSETRRWTRPWLPRTLVHKSINVEFNEEVGERSGSWKGGVLGTGFAMKEGETPLQAMRRMERDQKFN